MTTDLREHRWPIQPLLDISGLSTGELRRRLDLKHAVVAAASADGLTDVQADHWAIGLGWHPLSVWGWDWIDLADRAAPIHIRLAAVLREQIERGALCHGDQLPTLQAFADQYGTSRSTVTRAIAELRHERLVVTGPGCRFFVTRHDLSHDLDAEARAS